MSVYKELCLRESGCALQRGSIVFSCQHLVAPWSVAQRYTCCRIQSRVILFCRVSWCSSLRPVLGQGVVLWSHFGGKKVKVVMREKKICRIGIGRRGIRAGSKRRCRDYEAEWEVRGKIFESLSCEDWEMRWGSEIECNGEREIESGGSDRGPGCLIRTGGFNLCYMMK